MNKHHFKIEKLNLDNHKAAFCEFLIDLHKHYHSDSELNLAGVIEYFDSVLVRYLEKYEIHICVEQGKKIVGFSVCYDAVSFVELSEKRTRQMQLKELFVCTEYRGNGIGTLLMENVMRRAKAVGCYRIDWNVRDWNKGGIEFYKRIGAEFVKDRKSMRIEL